MTHTADMRVVANPPVNVRLKVLTHRTCWRPLVKLLQTSVYKSSISCIS